MHQRRGDRKAKRVDPSEAKSKPSETTMKAPNTNYRIGGNVEPRTSIRSLVLRKVLVSGALMTLLYLYYYWKDGLGDGWGNFQTFVSIKESVSWPPKGVLMPCSDDYQVERSRFARCAPARCGRFVSDSIVSEKETLELRLAAETIFSIVQPSGGVAIFDLSSGALSNGTQFVNFYKLVADKPNKILNARHFDIFKTVKNKIIGGIAHKFGVSADHLHLTGPVFFTRISNMPDRTLNDQYWHRHVDKSTYGTFVYTALLYLASYNEEFQGGRFVFIDHQRNRTVEPKFGRVLFFTSGAENEHFVEKVQSGARFALTIPFTCDPSKAIVDPKLIS